MKNMADAVPVPTDTETRAITTVPVTDTHTPGPWAWDAGPHDSGVQLRGANHEQVLAIDLPEFISDENKRLIASAPDLLEACRLAMDYWVADHPNDTSEAQAARLQIMTAINKARGR